MASEDRIDSIVDRAAIQKELSETSAEVRNLIELIRSVKNTSIQISGAKSVGEFNALNTQLKQQISLTNTATEAVKTHSKAVQEESKSLNQNLELRRKLQNTVNSYKGDQKEDVALLKSGAITRVEYNKRLTESQAKIETYKVRIAELNRVIKEDIALEGKAGDAYKQLSAEYNRAALAAKNYQITLGASNPITISAVKNAKGLSDQLKTVDNAVGQNTRNVGNYGGALVDVFKKAFGALRTVANILPGLGISGVLLLIPTLIGKAASALSSLGKETDRAARSQKVFNEVQEEAVKSTSQEIVTLNSLVSAAKNENATRDQRQNAIDELQKQYPDYLRNISLETINSEAATTAINELTQSILSKAVADEYAKRVATEAIKQQDLQNGVLKREAQTLSDINELQKLKGDKNTPSDAIKKFSGIVTENINKLGQQTKELKSQTEVVDDLKKGFDEATLASLKFIKTPKTPKKTKGEKDKNIDIAEANAKALFEIFKLEQERRAEFSKKIVDDEKADYLDRLLALNDYTRAKELIIQKTAEFELRTAKGKEIELVEAKRIDSLIRLSSYLSEAIKRTVKDFKDAERPLVRAVGSLQAEIDKIQQAAAKKLAEQLKNQKEGIRAGIKALLEELKGLVFDLFTGDIDRQKNVIQDRIDLLDKQKQKDIEVANQTITNAQDKAAAIAIIEARANAQKEQLEARQRELSQRRAKFERAEAIVNIISSTAQAVVKALASGPPPGNLIFAAIVGAIGAVQLARTLAQPIPKFAKGGTHKGGIMEVGEGGRAEGIVLPDGSVLKSPSRSTFMDAPAGTKIYPDFDKMMINATITKVPEFTVKTITDGTKDAINKIGKDIVRAIKSQPQTTFKGEPRWKVMTRIGSSFRNYLDNNL